MKETVRKIFIITGVVILVIALMVIPIYNYYNKKDKSNDSNTETTQSTSNETQNENAKFEGQTPCDVFIDYKNIIKTYGKPVYIKYPGLTKEVYYTGNGDLNISSNVECGTVHIRSANPKELNVSVEVFKIN